MPTTTPTAYHLVHYRRFELTGGNTKTNTLEALLRSALDTADDDGKALWERIQDRICTIDKERLLILNKTADQQDAVFGEICLVQSKGLQALIEQKAKTLKLSPLTTAEVFDLNERTAPQGTRFLRGLGYWLAIGNHLFFVKTHSVQADHFQDYFDWLLKVKTSMVKPTHTLQLQAEFDRSELGGDIGDIRRLRISGRYNAAEVTAAAAANEDAKPAKITERVKKVLDQSVRFKKAAEIASVLMGPEKAKALVNSLGPEEQLSADTVLRVTGRRTEKSKAQFKNIATALANTSDGKVQVDGKDGKWNEKDVILRVNMPFDLPYEDSSLLEFDNVADQLREVYSRFVKDKKIEA